MEENFLVDNGFYILRTGSNNTNQSSKIPILLDIPAENENQANQKVNQIKEFFKQVFYKKLKKGDDKISDEEIQNQIDGIFFTCMIFFELDKSFIINEPIIFSSIKHYLRLIIKLNTLRSEPTLLEVSKKNIAFNDKDSFRSKEKSLNELLLETAINYYLNELKEFTRIQYDTFSQDLNQLDPLNKKQAEKLLEKIRVLNSSVIIKQTTFNSMFVRKIITYLENSTKITCKIGTKSNGEQQEIAYKLLELFNLIKIEAHFFKPQMVNYIKILLKNNEYLLV